MVDDNPVLSYFGTCSIFPYPPRVGKIKNVFFGNPWAGSIDWFDFVLVQRELEFSMF
jgi:hypothetical protein